MAVGVALNVQAVYSVAVGDASAVDPLQEVTSFESVSLSFSLDAGSECSFTVPGQSAAARQISELASDVWLYRDEVLVNRFRVIGVGQVWGPDGDDTVSITAVSYKRLLHSRHVQFGATYTGEGQADIIADLVATTQATAGGDWGVTAGSLDNDGRFRDRTYVPGENIGTILENLSAVIDGPSWDIDGSLELNVRSGRAETFPVQTVPIMLGATARGLSRAAGTGSFANSVFVDGAVGTVPVRVDAADILVDPRGRWELTAGFPNVNLQDTLDEKADGLVEVLKSPLAQWSCDVEPSRYLTDCYFEPGDLVQVVVPATVAAPIGVPGFSEWGQVMSVSAVFTGDGDLSVSMEVIEVPDSVLSALGLEEGGS